MKLSKKILAALSAAALLATTALFSSCSDDEDDDGFIANSTRKSTGNTLLDNYMETYRNRN